MYNLDKYNHSMYNLDFFVSFYENPDLGLVCTGTVPCGTVAAGAAIHAISLIANFFII